MIEITNIQTHKDAKAHIKIPSSSHQIIDGSGLTALPALIDPHVHFRTPGMEYKENWESAAKACLAGGVTTVFDMPNTLPATSTRKNLEDKKALVARQLESIGIPLRYHFYFGADRTHFDQIALVKQDVIGIKVFMGSSTGDLLMEDDSSLHAIFALAKAHHLTIAVHAEDEEMIAERRRQFPWKEYIEHSKLRTPEVAARAVEKAIELAALYQTPLYILHVSSEAEIALIRKAKRANIQVYAETTPHHLFLSTDDYAKWGAKVQVNPPLRDPSQHKHLFDAIADGTIDMIGSDHAPHTLEEKALPYGQAPSGIPGIECILPLLLDAHHRGLLSLEKIVSLTSARAGEVFQLEAHDDWVIVDLHKKKAIQDSALKTKCGWSPYCGKELQGWPVKTILKGKIYDV